MSRWFQQLIWLFFLSFGINGLSENVFAQTTEAKNLTRNDVLIKSNKTSIYICIDRNSTLGKERAKSEVVLKIYNNTIWTIRFGAESSGTSAKMLKLSNGKNVAALTNESIAYPLYQIESRKKTKGKIDEPAWGDVHTASWLPSNTSASFSIPTKYFKENDLYINYFYEWEFIDSIGNESYAPNHRVHFYLENFPNIGNYFCDEN